MAASLPHTVSSTSANPSTTADLPVFVLEPVVGPKKRDSFAKPLHATLHQDRQSDVEALRKQLVGIRRKCQGNEGDLTERFRSAVARRSGVRVTVAGGADDAAKFLLETSGGAGRGSGRFGTNKSAVLAEIVGPLREAGAVVVDSYFSEFRSFEKSMARSSELPDLDPASILASLPQSESLRPFSLRARAPRDFVGVLGVNAASAEDGAIFFLQHFTNITKILLAAQRLVLVVAVDKILPDRSAADLQTRLTAVHGWRGILLGLENGRKESVPGLEAFPPVTGDGGGLPDIDILLLDNGRSAVARHALHASLLRCIGCRACMVDCPTYPAFRTESRLNPRDYALRFIREEGREEGASVALCSSCRRCSDACPMEIDIALSITEARSDRRGQGDSGTWRDRLIGRVELASRVLSMTAPLSGWILRLAPARWLAEKTMGLARQRTLPRFHRRTLRAWHRRRPARDGGEPIVYFHGCYANWNNPDLGRAVVEVLERNGYRVILPKQRCSGMPLLTNGDRKGAEARARANIASLVPHVRQGRTILASCSSCALSLRRDYLNLVDSDDARAVSAATRNVTEFLLDLHRKGKLRKDFGSLDLRIGYHLPCHLKAQGLEGTSLELLGIVPGVEVEDIPTGCSGMSGTFGLKSRNYALSMQIGEPMFARLNTGALTAGATDCGACTLQMEHGSRLPVLHPAEVLAQGYRAADREARA